MPRLSSSSSSSSSSLSPLHHCHIQHSNMHQNHHHNVLCILFFLLYFNLMSPVRSEIQTIKISSDSRQFILLEDFGFSNQGFISLDISSVSITPSDKSIINPIRLSRIGCFYAPTPARHAIKLALLNDICLIGKPFVFPIITFNEKILRPKSHHKASVPVSIPDLYYIFFANCAKNSTVSMTVDLKTYNVDSGGDPYYIDDQFTPLPTSLYIFAIVHFCFLVAWSYKSYKSRALVHKIHILMAVLLLFRFLELICYANSQNSIQHDGIPHGWNILWLTFYVARSILFVVVIMLIGYGWSLFKLPLQELRTYMMIIAVSFQVVANICFILTHTIGPSDKYYRYWILTYYAADFICCIAMMVPIRSSMDKLDMSVTAEGKEGRRMAHKRLIENFELAIYVYVGFTRLFLFVVRTMTSYRYWCLTVVLELFVELMFYILVYLLFWPAERFEYAVVDDRKEDTVPAALPGGIEFDLKRWFSQRFL